jgi:hypothetical protein
MPIGNQSLKIGNIRSKPRFVIVALLLIAIKHGNIP